MQAVILSIGDELVLGQTIDTNSAFLSAHLVRLGVGTLYHQVVSDDQEAIHWALKLASEKAQLVLVTGGLGPTDDDLTRQALAQALDTELVLDPASLADLEGFFARRQRTMPPRNRIQAMHPRGTEVIPNTCGTAPGIKAKLKGATIYVTPGVPREMVVMFEQAILPELQQLTGGRQAIATCTLHSLGLGESDVAERLGELMDRQRNPKVGTTVSAGLVSVRIRSEFASPVQAQREMEATIALVEERLGPIVFGRDDQTLQHSLLRLLSSQKQTLATAESCTGGLLGKLITDVPGASSGYLGGWVTYANAFKSRELGVPAGVLERFGAVSEQVVLAMADGALAASGADLALAITGIAGPEGGSVEKPVGTVWIGLAQRGKAGEARSFLLGNDREMIRDRAAKCALQLLRLRLLGLPLEALTWGKSGISKREA